MAIAVRKMNGSARLGKHIAELQTVNSATAGTMTAGKALIPTTGGLINTHDITALKIGGVAVTATAAELNASVAGLTATTDELNRVADVSGRIVTITATGAITEALHDGKTCVLADSGGDTLVTLTLPAATGGGARFRFVVGVVNTSSYVFKSVAGTDLMEGLIFGASTTDSATDAARTWASGASDDTVTLNGTTMGGAAIGDWVEFEDFSATGWAVRGMVTQSGAEATPFSNTVA
jgi:hypothetical protein